MEWWRDERGENPTRDYFRVESEDGARFWIYRIDREQYGRHVPSWYIHGVFA
jgi:protein ImuB